MSKDHEVHKRTPGDVPLHDIHGRESEDSTDTQDFDRFLSDDPSVASSTDLPLVDGGRGAWLCLLGCWLAEAMIWGFAMNFGVFQRHYTSHLLFEDSNSIPTVGTLATGVSYLGMPFVAPIAIRWPQHRRKMCATGWCICLLGLAAASLATKISQLLIFQGVVYGIGWSICFTTFLFILNEWWIEKRGLAYGILFAASGVSGSIIPFALDWMLETYGFRTALRAYGIAIVVLSGPGLFLIQHRLPPSKHANPEEKPRMMFAEALKPLRSNRHFFLFSGAVLFQGLGFFVPNIFIPPFSQILGLSSRSSSGLLAIMAVSQILGQLWQGWLSDRTDVYVPASVSTIACALAACFLWGLAKGVPWLIPFAILWGFFSASYSVLYTRMVSFLLNGERKAVPTDDRVGMLIYGFFSFERGLSNTLAGPISSWLLGAAGRRYDWEHFGLGRYAYIIWFTVVCMAASSLFGVVCFQRGSSRLGAY